MNIAFVCWRPYQVFNIIRLMMSNTLGCNNSYDLYIESLPSLLMLKNQLDRCGFFRGIYYFKTSIIEEKNKNTILARVYSWLVLFIEYLFTKYNLKKNDLSGIKHSYNKYDIIMSSGWLSYFINLANANPTAHVYMFEDGIGSYFGDERSCWISEHLKSKKFLLFCNFLNTFLHKGPFSVNVSKMYINQPAWVVECYPYEVLKMPLIDEATVNKIKMILGYHEPSIYKGEKSVVYLSEDVYSDMDMELKICSILEKIKDKLVVRPHPRYQFTPAGFDIDRSNILWELLTSDLDNYILISKYSSAMLTASLLYPDKNFTFIFLYKIMEASNNHSIKIKTLINSFTKMNPRTFFPDTFEEFETLIRRLALMERNKVTKNCQRYH